MEKLTRDRILAALEGLNGRIEALGVRAQIYLVGGAVMCLVHRAREATKYVDAWFTEPVTVRAAAKAVAADLGLPEDWLNDAAKAFIPADAGFDRSREYSSLDLSVADDRTLFAMKCAAARTAEDAADIEFLARRLRLRSSSAAVDRARILPARAAAGPHQAPSRGDARCGPLTASSRRRRWAPASRPR